MRTSRISQQTARIANAMSPQKSTSAASRRVLSARSGNGPYVGGDAVVKLEDAEETAELAINTADSTVTTMLGKRKRGAGIVKLEVEERTSSPRRSSRKAVKVEEGGVDVKTPTKVARSPVKRISGPNGTVKTEAPANWEEVYAITTEMRKRVIAPVDTMGCEDLAEKTRSPRDQRLQTLIALMLSSQTKDPVTAAAIRSLQEGLPGGLNLESLLE
ncbi:alpha,alpha-trehalase nth1, partial [Oleoguttula sp. CCFEE 5521]